MNPSLNGKKIAVVGLGVSNLSAVRYLLRAMTYARSLFLIPDSSPRV